MESKFCTHEISQAFKQLGFNEKKFNEVLGCNTAIIIKGETVTYRHDISSALSDMLDNDKSFLYWD